MAKIDRFPKYDFLENGTVVSNTRKNPFTMSPIKCGQYLGLQLVTESGHSERHYLHSLICEAFHGPRENGKQCGHKDGNRLNNSASNLYWVTPKENCADKDKHGTSGHGEKNPMAVLTVEKVMQMRNDRKESGASYAALGRKYNVSTMTAYRAVVGQSWSKA